MQLNLFLQLKKPCQTNSAFPSAGGGDDLTLTCSHQTQRPFEISCKMINDQKVKGSNLDINKGTKMFHLDKFCEDTTDRPDIDLRPVLRVADQKFRRSVPSRCNIVREILAWT